MEEERRQDHDALDSVDLSFSGGEQQQRYGDEEQQQEEEQDMDDMQIEIFETDKDGNVALPGGPGRRKLTPAAPTDETWRQNVKRKLRERCALVKPRCPPNRMEMFQYIVEGLSLALLIILIATVVPTEHSQGAWFLPFVGVLGSTIGAATPAGGGVIFFPVLTAMGRSTEFSAGFSVATQFVGMGIFSTLNWVRHDMNQKKADGAPSIIHWKAIAPVVGFGCLGALLSFFAFPIENPVVIRVIFSCFTMLLAIYILVGVFCCSMQKNKGFFRVVYTPRFCIVNPRAWREWCVMFMIGFVGGIFVAWFATGVDIIFFFVTTFFYQLDPQVATVSSVLSMGYLATFAFFVMAVAFNAIPWFDWLMVLPGVIIGARVGPVFNILIGRRPILIFFSVLLIIEFIRTMVDVGTGQII